MESNDDSSMDFKIHFEGPIIRCAELHQKWFTGSENGATKKVEKRIKKDSTKLFSIVCEDDYDDEEGSSSSSSSDDDDDGDDIDDNSTKDILYKKQHSMPFLQRTLCFTRKKSKATKPIQTSSTKAKAKAKRPNAINKSKRKKKKAINIIERLLKSNYNKELKFSSTGTYYKKRKHIIIDSSSPFPLYDPIHSGPPILNNKAYTLFCNSNYDTARSKLSRDIKNDKHKIEEQLKLLWNKVNDDELTQWYKNEEWDCKRYEHQKTLYIKVIFKRPTVAGSSKVRTIDVRSIYHDDSKKMNYRNFQQPKAFFHFVYMKDNVPVTQSCPAIGFSCPICNYRAKSALELVGHCKAAHYGLSFDAVYDEEQVLHVKVTGDELGNNTTTTKSQYEESFKYIRNKRKSQRFKIPHITEFDISTRERIISKLQSQKVPQHIINRYIPCANIPIRQYYHSRTNTPIITQEEFDIDSDAETDDGWLHTISNELLEDFEDVTYYEKIFMKLWNSFMVSHYAQSDKDIVLKCKEFITCYKKDLLSYHPHLKKYFLYHLLNLYHWSLISSKEISSLMVYYDSICSSAINSTSNQTTASSSSNSKEHDKTTAAATTTITNTNSLLSKQHINGSKVTTSYKEVSATPSLQNSLTSQSDDATTTMNQDEDISSNATDNEIMFYV